MVRLWTGVQLVFVSRGRAASPRLHTGLHTLPRATDEFDGLAVTVGNFCLIILEIFSRFSAERFLRCALGAALRALRAPSAALRAPFSRPLRAPAFTRRLKRHAPLPFFFPFFLLYIVFHQHH